MITRVHDWDRRLADYLDAAGRTPFAWGVHDCCTFACGAVLTQAGFDPMADLRGRYASQAEAEALLAGAGGTLGAEEALQALDVRFRGPHVPPLLAQRGDVALLSSAIERRGDAYVAQAGPAALAVVGLNGREVLVLHESGLRRLPLRLCRCVWRIG